MTPKIAFVVYVLLGLVVLGLFLTGKNSDDHEDWPIAFLGWFDRIFAARTVQLPLLGAVHLPSLKRSILASGVSLIVLGTIWVVNKDTLSRPLRYESFGEIGALGLTELGTLGLIYGGATLITNWIPDYLSLIESRIIMGKLATTKSPLARLLWLGLDAFLTLAIAFSAICVGAWLILPMIPPRITLEVGCFTAETFTMKDAWSIFISGLQFKTPPATLNYDAAGIYIYSTFLTSLWIWLYLLAGRLLRGFAGLIGAGQSTGRPAQHLSISALASLTLTYWPSWALIHQPQVDVHIMLTSPQKDEARAEQLKRALEVEGFSVSASDNHNRKAELVIRLGSGFGAGAKARDSWQMAQREVICGHRPKGSLKTSFTGEDVERLVFWAKHAPSLLKRYQLAQCRALDGLPPLPSYCGDLSKETD